MDITLLSPLIIIAAAALIHASFQLSVSVLTLLSGHSLGKKTRHTRVMHLMNSFIAGVLAFTLLLLSSVVYYLSSAMLSTQTSKAILAASCGLLIGLGLAVWIFYYRKGDGTTLWLPRSMAQYLFERTKKTRSGAEAFGLGMSSVVAELLFIIAPLSIAAIEISRLPTLAWQVGAILGYVVLSLLALLIIFVVVGSGHRLSSVQKWRERNKRFLQFSAGGGLLVLGGYVFVDQIWTPIAKLSGMF